jgi:ferritin-like metal-binding protein YciE
VSYCSQDHRRGSPIFLPFGGQPKNGLRDRASAQLSEHYEISRYGTLRTWAEELGLQQAVRLLEITLREEEKTDEALTELAETCVNQEAQQQAAE